jgi:predicted DCC family thiol-disulfide oxidoreductase YuxK
VNGAATDSETLEGSHPPRDGFRPAKPRGGHAIKNELRRTYFELDPRTLAFGRIFFALVLIGDLLRRIPWIREFYTNAGVLPNHTVLWRPPIARSFSLFFMSSLPEESAIWFAICFVCFFFFLIGWRTRLFHVLSFVMTTSLHNRMLFAENWGGVAIAALMVWTVWLPMGRRISVDAVLASLRARRHETPDDLAAGLPAPDNTPARSLAVFGLLLQIAIIYWFNFVHKSGVTWKDGSAVYYVLHQERIITWLGLQIREHVPYAVTKLLTFGTLVIEAAAPFLILTPVFWRVTRPLTILLLAGLHGSIAAMTNLGIFSAAMIAFEPFLLDTVHWNLLARLATRKRRTRTVFYDVDCGVCFLIARVLARLDVYRRLRLVSNRDAAALSTHAADIDRELLDRTILVVESPETPGRRWTRGDAVYQILAVLPLGRLWAWPLRLPGVRALANACYDAVSRNRTGVEAPAKPQTPLRTWARARLPFVREVGIALMFVVLAAEVSVANPSIPRAFRFERRPEWMVAAVMYPHIFESWSLFSPEAPLSDETVVVDAVTRDGRHVDPYNEVGSRVSSLPVESVPVRLGHDSFWCDYTLRIPDAGQYHQALIEWILRYHERTGHDADQIVRFDAYVIWQDSPKPGEPPVPTNIRKRRFLHFPEGSP